MDPVSKEQLANKAPTKYPPGRHPNTLKNMSKPGMTNNPTGRPHKKPITEIFDKVLSDPANREKIYASVLDIMTSGRMSAVLLLKEAADRLEGRVKEEIEINNITQVTDEDLEQKLKTMRNVITLEKTGTE